MTAPSRRRTPAARAGFTLIEMLAVVAIFALMAAFVVPNLSSLSGRSLRREATQLANHLELARQRSIMTSIPHRVYIDLDDPAYRIEWLRTEAEALGEEEAAPDEAPPGGPPGLGFELRADVPLPLAAPVSAVRDYWPLPGVFGRFRLLDDEIFFAGIETPEGTIDHGQAYIGFDRDGSATWTQVVLESEDGGQLLLEVLPLAEAVRVIDEF